MPPLAEVSSPKSQQRRGIALIPLVTAIVIMLIASIRPDYFVRTDGNVRHVELMLTFYTMSIGFVRGVGFIPVFWLWRQLFSSYAFILSLILTVWIMFR